MQLAVNIPNFGDYADPRVVAELAADAEEAGWDGFFVWDHLLVWDGNPVGDPWVQLAAAAAATERVRLGPMVTPLPRRRPWIVARQAVSLDQLSGGRLVLGVGLGSPPDTEFSAFDEESDDRIRADKLDEGLAVITGMWSGKPFAFDGDHFRLEEHTFLPAPVQQPRIPIWVAASWPRRRPLRRAARFDGVVPLVLTDAGLRWPEPAEAAVMAGEFARLRNGLPPGDVAVVVPLTGDVELVAAYGAAGATWLQLGPDPSGAEDAARFRGRVREGPPRS